MPRFSVIIATYNRSHLLKRALISLLNQSFADWEAIIIDDGSVDKTKDVVKYFVDIDSRFRYFYQENKGVDVAKNIGVSFSNGEWITFLDSDDEYLPMHLENRALVLTENPQIQLLHGGVKVIGDQYVPDLIHEGLQIHLSKCIVGATFFMTKNTFVNLGGFKKMQFGADFDFYMRAIRIGIKTMKCMEPSYVYHRENNDSITHEFDISI
ncbi:MAG: glycosyltransferase family 2 protein [Chitinophagales bacterium]|nr:glycosyltransferase family 2 protein [Chitinophagales bacterium]